MIAWKEKVGFYAHRIVDVCTSIWDEADFPDCPVTGMKFGFE
jgi:hypothetical protein